MFYIGLYKEKYEQIFLSKTIRLGALIFGMWHYLVETTKFVQIKPLGPKMAPTWGHSVYILNIDNPYFEQMVGQMYPTELQLNKANSSDTEAPFLDLNLSITNGIVSSKIYDKRDDFNFEIVNFPFLDGDVPRSPSYGVYISQLIRFARVCSNVDDFNNRNLFLTAKLLKQGYRYHKIRKAFSKFYYRHSELIVKYNIGLKTLLQQGISEPIFYGDLVYKFKRIVGNPNFSDQFKKIVKRYIRVGYNLDIMRQSACLVLNPITVYSYGFLFNCTTVGQASDSMMALT